MEILIENRNFDRKSKFFLSKIDVMIENRCYDRKWKFGSKIEVLIEHRNLDRKSQPSIEILMTEDSEFENFVRKK